MTDRERWIVYPLLFLALGSALRDKLAKQTQAKQITCEQLVLVDSDGRPTAFLIGDPTTQIGPAELAVARQGGARFLLSYLNAKTVDAEMLAQGGRLILGSPQQGTISLQQLLQQVLPQLQMAPGLPQGEAAPPNPGQEAPPAGEAPNQEPSEPATPQTAPADSEPAPAA